jgi:hypothetical protein
MDIQGIAFQVINWQSVQPEIRQGQTGVAYWQTVQFNGLRIRLVEYSQDYLADHWCQMGHIVFCLEGELTSELQDGQSFRLSKGMSYIVSDNMSAHRSISASGVKLLIVDGDFLRPGGN